MELILLPSLIAISLKIAIFIRYQESLRNENLNLGIFFLAAFLLNLVELISLDHDYSRHTMLLLLLSYYCCAVFVVHAYLNIALQYARISWHLNRVKLVLNGLLAVLVVGLIFDRSIIADVTAQGYSLTRVVGPNYWIFQLYTLGGLLLGAGLLLRGALRLTANIDRQQCLIVLLSTLPMVATGISIITLQALGIDITAALFMSLALTLMVGMMVFAEEKTRLFRLLTFIPFTRERRLHKQLLAQLTDYLAINDDPADQQPLQLKQMMREFEGLIVDHVLDYYHGNQKLTANALGVSESTLSRRARANAEQRRTQSESPATIAVKE